MCGSLSSPSTVHRQKNLRQISNEFRLLLRREHQIAVALFFGSQRSEDPASNTEVGRSHMRTFFDAFKAESNLAEI